MSNLAQEHVGFFVLSALPSIATLGSARILPKTYFTQLFTFSPRGSMNTPLSGPQPEPLRSLQLSGILGSVESISA